MAEYKCEKCNIIFKTFQTKANHVRWAHKDNSEYLKSARKTGILVNEKRFGAWVYETVICSKEGCKNSTVAKYREGKKKEKYFCSRSCANSRGKRTDEEKIKISKSVSKAWDRGDFDNINYTEVNKYFSSKTERLIIKHFKEKYPADDWMSGGRIKLTDGIYTARDLYSNKLKICFEYDGIWHFKDIRNQLKEKQLKDKKLEEWCIINDYRLIRVDEDFFESVQQIEDLIYKSKEKIIKIGNRY